ncbi:putative ubiquitin-specific protease UBP9 NDAI_0A01670 [Naumovozyma dairenensis CBS 421]|uniref:Ubiquitin carboxyl-terminal hydrolase n=1 Tax=Naumovozyma dairenensis (strain ATCC 10597 / BCRC 20456 / CBS 421 / NBRC 0211 / NRRL Y-12639) TaxID=1071378 RepID=G0W3D7_NAUDC|nr:hypothetical protein NDAI_0A01670 [Naumovozyma dairenensis CBS 421]CCD22325.1 hypothetical protein NDAI_0A01670 [Naumovozyma dairenensis CBS 421]
MLKRLLSVNKPNKKKHAIDKNETKDKSHTHSHLHSSDIQHHSSRDHIHAKHTTDVESMNNHSHNHTHHPHNNHNSHHEKILEPNTSECIQEEKVKEEEGEEKEDENEERKVLAMHPTEPSKVVPPLPPPSRNTSKKQVPATIVNNDDTLNSAILFTPVSDLIPYGDGSNKVFGYENFGNTCYCNSVLQCLYNLYEFRLNMLEYSDHLPHNYANIENRRIRKLDMKGLKPRIFTEASFDSNNNKPNTTTITNTSSNDNEIDNNNNINNNETYQDYNNLNSKNTTNNNNNNNNKRNSFMGFQVPSKQQYNNNKDTTVNNKQDGNNNNNNNNNSTNNAKSQSYTAKMSSLLGAATSNSNPNMENGKDKNGNVNTQDDGIIHATLMSSDVTTEKLHSGCQDILVGRINNNNNNNRFTKQQKPNIIDELSNSKESYTPIFSKTNNNNNNNNNNNIPHNIPSNNIVTPVQKPTSEQRKKAALINGPVLNVDHLLNQYEKANLYNSLKDIFESITENRYLTGIVAPTEFVKILKKENVLFNSMMQQDSHEFLNFLLNELRDYLPSTTNNFITNLFQGILTNQIKCLTCDNITSRDEPFLDFPIGVKDDEETNIETLLRNYHTREMLNGSNKFYCNQCCGLQEAERIVGLKQLPHILALHLKRFKYSEVKNTNIKLFNKVYYPLTLNVASTFDSSIEKAYELTGVVIHMGSSPQHGHYVSLCKNDKFGWLLFDDETVESVSESTVLEFTGDPNNQATAYVLFYKEIKDIVKYYHSIETHHDKFKNNINELIKCDDAIRIEQEKQRKIQKKLHDEQMERERLSMNELDKNIERKGSHSANNKTKRKSRILSFMKS